MKLVMVDLDGTLFDTRRVNYQSYAKAMEEFGYSLDYNYYCDECNGKYYMDFLPQITTSDTGVLRQIHKRKCELYREYLDSVVINDKLIDILSSVKKEYRIALVTTASKTNTFDILDRFGLGDFFDLILTREEVNFSKPNPEGFIKAMKYFEAKPEECIVFEDSDIGVMAAERTGAAVFVVKGYN